MAFSARDVMSRHVVSVAPEGSLIDVYRVFVEEGIHGAPVVDEANELQGVITSADLLRAVSEQHESAGSDSKYFRDLMEFSTPDWLPSSEDFQDRLSELTVSDFMTETALTVAPEASAQEVARQMCSHQVHRVFVVEDQLVVGIVSALDLVALIDKHGEALAE